MNLLGILGLSRRRAGCDKRTGLFTSEASVVTLIGVEFMLTTGGKTRPIYPALLISHRSAHCGEYSSVGNCQDRALLREDMGVREDNSEDAWESKLP